MHSSELRDLFREYLQAVRKFVEVHGRCIVKGWPDRKDAIEVATRLAYLNCDVQAWRLDYLWEQGLLERKPYQSLSGIFDRLNKEWSESEEAALKASNEPYREAVTDSDVARTRLDPPALEGPSGDLRRDKEYLRALEDLRQKAQSLDAQLQKLATGKSP
jgi:hypothetical protein